MRKFIIAIAALVVVGGGLLWWLKPFSEPAKEAAATTKKQDKEVLPLQFDIQPDQAVTIELGKEVKSLPKVTVKNGEGKAAKAAVEISEDHNSITVQPPSSGFAKGELYTVEIAKGLEYADGKKSEKPMEQPFFTYREEVEVVEQAKAIVEVPEATVVTADMKQIVVEKTNLTEKLEKGSILTVPVDEPYTKEAAFRVTNIKEKDGDLQLSVEQPGMLELFDELDVKKKFSPTEAYVTVSSPGVTVRNVTSSYLPSFGNVTASVAPTKVAFDKKKISRSNPKDEIFKVDVDANGVIMDIQNLKIPYPLKGKQKGEIELKGNVTTLTEFDTDIKLKRPDWKELEILPELETFRFTADNTNTASLTAAFKPTGGKLKSSDSVKYKLGSYSYPLGSTGLVGTVDIYAYLNIKVDGSVEVEVKFEEKNQWNCYYINEEEGFDTSYGVLSQELTPSLRGTQTVKVKVGADLGVEVSVLKAVGLSLHEKAGGYGDLKLEEGSENYFVPCATGEWGLFQELTFEGRLLSDTIFAATLTDSKVPLKTIDTAYCKWMDEEAKKQEEERKRQEEEAKRVPTDEEIKEIMKKSYKLLDVIKAFSEQGWSSYDGIKPQWEPFAEALRPYFTESYLNKIKPNLDQIFTPTDAAFPGAFEFERHFVVKSKSASSFTAEAYEDVFEIPAIFTITAKKENGEWKIDDWGYQEKAGYGSSGEASGSSGGSGSSAGPKLTLNDPNAEYLKNMTVGEYASDNGMNRFIMIEFIMQENPHISADPVDVNNWVDEKIRQGQADRSGKLLKLVESVLAEHGY